jgi:hypothetical protein
MELGDFIKASHVRMDCVYEGEIVAFDDDGYITLLENNEQYCYIYSGHFYLKKLSGLEIELL